MTKPLFGLTSTLSAKMQSPFSIEGDQSRSAWLQIVSVIRQGAAPVNHRLLVDYSVTQISTVDVQLLQQKDTNATVIVSLSYFSIIKHSILVSEETHKIPDL